MDAMICGAKKRLSGHIQLFVHGGCGLIFMNFAAVANPWWQPLLNHLPPHQVVMSNNHVHLVSFVETNQWLLLRSISSARLSLPPFPKPPPIIVWEDVFHTNPTLVTQMLLVRMGIFSRLHARKMQVEEISNTMAMDFLNANHLQGFVKAPLHLGLMEGPYLRAVASFSKGRPWPGRIDGENVLSFELLRIASEPGTRISGGIDKLLHAFFDRKGSGHLMTYTDREWSEGLTFQKLGFEHAGVTEPVGFYVNRKTLKREYMHRSNQVEPGPDQEQIQNMGNDKWVCWFNSMKA